MILKIKALIYRLTGIYLAHREQLEYMESKKFYKDLHKLYTKNDDLSLEVCYSILICMWQSDHGFYRSFKIRK